MTRALIAALFCTWIAGPANAQTPADSVSASCISIAAVTTFAPRGEIYVVVQPSCVESDFDGDAPILAYLEVLIGDLPPIGQDVRVYPEEPRTRQTFFFDDLLLETGDSVLVRLVRFGEILSLKHVKVP